MISHMRPTEQCKGLFYARQNVGVGLTHHPPPPTPHIIHTGTFKTINDMFAFNL